MRKFIALVLALCLVFCTSILTSAEDITDASSIKQQIIEGLTAFKEEIDLRQFNIPKEEINQLLYEVRFTHPELFHFYERVKVYAYSGSGMVAKIVPEYRMSATEYEVALEKYNRWINRIASEVSPDATDLEKLLYVHEYLVANYEYDKSYQIYDAYNFFENKKGVCQAYTLAFTAIMQKLGVFVTTALNLDSVENHCWNIVRLDGKYYHVDVTGDDATYAIKDSHDNVLGELIDGGSREMFLVSDDAIKTFSNHSQWTVVGGAVVCDSKIYEDKFWNDYQHPLATVNGEVYQMISEYSTTYDDEEQIQIYRIDASGERTVIANLSFPAFISAGYYCFDVFNIFAVGDELYGVTNNRIWRYNFEKGEAEIVDNSYSNIIGASYIGNGKIKLMFVEDIDHFYCDHSVYSYGYYQLPLGDTDGDGEFAPYDLITFKKYILTGNGDFNAELLDLNGDLILDILDFIRMKKNMVLD
ncbi:MAG: transglutaminase domain-containing protein [Oscillospiraceae bacterium]|nr:transglutaminase domain-containing protein [Oscillospiraceae bacterium]